MNNGISIMNMIMMIRCRMLTSHSTSGYRSVEIPVLSYMLWVAWVSAAQPWHPIPTLMPRYGEPFNRVKQLKAYNKMKYRAPFYPARSRGLKPAAQFYYTLALLTTLCIRVSRVAWANLFARGMPPRFEHFNRALYAFNPRGYGFSWLNL